MPHPAQRWRKPGRMLRNRAGLHFQFLNRANHVIRPPSLILLLRTVRVHGRERRRSAGSTRR
jgi:hypothetical protein